MPGKRTIYTIGHSNRPLEDFIELLTENSIERLVDVRSIPMSRANPQFNKSALTKSLEDSGIEYLHMPELGGRRGKQKNSRLAVNSAWEHSAFRNYADYALTGEFREGLEQLIKLAREKRTAYMCSEAVWWRCHRRIITDYLLARGWHVKHIMAPGKTTDAEMNEMAVVKDDGSIIYPGEQTELELD